MCGITSKLRDMVLEYENQGMMIREMMELKRKASDRCFIAVAKWMALDKCFIKCNGRDRIPDMKGVFSSTQLVKFFSQILKKV